MNTNALFSALAKYIEVLAESARTTSRAEDRSKYQHHLAEAAAIFLAIQQRDADALVALLANEERNFGWSFLADPPGEAATNAWVEFLAIARRTP